MKKSTLSQLNSTSMKNLKSFVKMGADIEPPDNIPTGHFALDFILHYGEDPSNIDLSKINYEPSKPLGLPLGKLVEIYGEEGGGKSSLGYRIAGYAQKKGYPAAWIDTEHSFSKNLAEINGCNVQELLYSNLVNDDNPEDDFHAEKVIDNMIELCKAGVKVIILDSVANLIPKERAEKDAENKQMGLLARVLSDNLGKVVGYAEKYGTLLVFINQLRKDLNVMFGDDETTKGGNSLKHNASVRIKISKRNTKKANIVIPDEDNNEDKIIGRHSIVRIKKNRFAKPFFDSISIPVYYVPYFPGIEEIAFNVGRQMKLISVRKKVYKWDEIKIEGKDNFMKEIKSQGLVSKLIKDIKAKANKEGILIPPELLQYNLKDDDEGMEKTVSRDRKTKDSRSSKK
ncbi:MAG: hypothetical protein ACOCRK_02230 [bacterium]